MGGFGRRRRMCLPRGAVDTCDVKSLRLCAARVLADGVTHTSEAQLKLGDLSSKMSVVHISHLDVERRNRADGT